jgi:AMP-binding enzyme
MTTGPSTNRGHKFSREYEVNNGERRRRELSSAPRVYVAVVCLVIGTLSPVNAFTISPTNRFRTVPRINSAVNNFEFLTLEEEAFLFGDHGDVNLKQKNGKSTPTLVKVSSPTSTKPLKISKSDSASKNAPHQDASLAQKLHRLRHEKTFKSCPEIWKVLAQIHPQGLALIDEHLSDTRIQYTFAQMDNMVSKAATALAHLVPESTAADEQQLHVAMFAENCAQWLVADQGLQRAGMVSAVRGADAPLDELRYIYQHCDSAGLVILQNPKLLKKLALDSSVDDSDAPLGFYNERHGPVHTVVLLNADKSSPNDLAQMASDYGVRVLLLADLLSKTAVSPDHSFPQLDEHDISTMVYTSGRCFCCCCVSV